MLGILFYSLVAFGLGLLAPVRSNDGAVTIGIRFTLGAALLLIAIYVCAVILALPLRLSVMLIAAAALLGWLRAALAFDRQALAVAVTHPALLLPLLGLAAVLANGGIGYIPYLIDEFTNWIGVSRVIHWAGSYEAVRTTLYLPGYTPGWRLLLLMPWQIGGTIEPGWSASITLVLHVAVLALIYDLLAYALRHHGGLADTQARLGAWFALLVLLTAEAMGRLWTYEMLVEQPQIYLLAAAALLLVRAELLPAARQVSHWCAGAVLAGGFLLKNAISAAAPGAALAALAPLLGKEPLKQRLKQCLIAGVAMLGPLLLAVFSWNAVAPPDGCLASPLSVLMTGIPAGYDPFDLARRFGGAVGHYVAVYKLPLTLAAAVGFAFGIYAGFWRSALLWSGFTAAYLAALYWYHLTCFGDYYYHELNSIPRFTRVPLQVFHAVGLVLLVIAPLQLPSVRELMACAATFMRRPVPLIAGLALIVTLGSWQARQTYRSVVDLTTRVYQNADPRIAEMHRASIFIERRAGRDLPAQPTLTILGQSQDGDVRGYAEYFAQRAAPGGHTSLYRVGTGTSWSPAAPVNVWQTRATADAVLKELTAADILWPLQLDPWLIEQLRVLVPDESCIARLPDAALVRDNAAATPRFRCVAKDS